MFIYLWTNREEYNLYGMHYRTLNYFYSQQSLHRLSFESIINPSINWPKANTGSIFARRLRFRKRHSDNRSILWRKDLIFSASTIMKYSSTGQLDRELNVKILSQSQDLSDKNAKCGIFHCSDIETVVWRKLWSGNIQDVQKFITLFVFLYLR